MPPNHVLLLLALGVVTLCIHQAHCDGFLEDFFHRFPHLPFAHQIPPNEQNNAAYYRTLDYMLKKSESPNRQYAYNPTTSTQRKTTRTTTSTTTTTTTTTVITTASEAEVRGPEPLIGPNNDIWFGSTPSPMFRGHTVTMKPPSIKFTDVKLQRPHRLGNPYVQPQDDLQRPPTASPSTTPEPEEMPRSLVGPPVGRPVWNSYYDRPRRPPPPSPTPSDPPVYRPTVSASLYTRRPLPSTNPPPPVHRPSLRPRYPVGPPVVSAALPFRRPPLTKKPTSDKKPSNEDKRIYPFDFFDVELKEPPYMTDPDFTLPINLEDGGYGLKDTDKVVDDDYHEVIEDDYQEVDEVDYEEEDLPEKSQVPREIPPPSSYYQGSGFATGFGWDDPYALDKPNLGYKKATPKPHELKSLPRGFGFNFDNDEIAQPAPHEVRSLPESPRPAYRHPPTRPTYRPTTSYIPLTSGPTYATARPTYRLIPTGPTYKTAGPPYVPIPTHRPFFRATHGPLLNDAQLVTTTYHNNGLDRFFENFKNFELHKIGVSANPVDVVPEFDQLTKKSHKSQQDLAYVYFEIADEPIYRHTVKQPPKPHVTHAPYQHAHDHTPKHHHYNHKHHHVTHIPLKYTGNFQENFDLFDPVRPGDEIQKQINSIDDPWLPPGPDIVKITPGPVRLETYHDHHYDYTVLRSKKQVPKDDLSFSLNSDQGFRKVQNAFGNLDNFHDNEDFVLEQPPTHSMNIDSGLLNNDGGDSSNDFDYEFFLNDNSEIFDNFRDDADFDFSGKDKFVTSTLTPAIEELKKGFVANIKHTPRPTRIHVKPKGQSDISPTSTTTTTTTTTKRPAAAPTKKFLPRPQTPKRRPPSLKFPKRPFQVPKMPFQFTKRPASPIPKLLPILGQVAKGYKTLISDQSDKMMDFMGNIFGKNKIKGGGLFGRRAGEAEMAPVQFVPKDSSEFVSSQEKYSKFLSRFNSSKDIKTKEFSKGGLDELSPLEQIKVMLRTAHDDPVLRRRKK
jgi:hypothetical protein